MFAMMRRATIAGFLSIFCAGAAWAGSSKIQVLSDGFLSINLQPHFVIGLYQSGHLEEMAEAGFSGTHNYSFSAGEADEPVNSTDERLRVALDRNATNGLRMMVELPRKAIEKGKWDQVRHRIEAFRNHPGLLCWGSEERVARGLTSLTNIIQLYHLVHELDPNHPLVLGDTKDVIKKLQVDRRDFFPDQAMDIGIWWWYPIPLKDKDENGVDLGAKKLLQPPAWLTTTWSKRPLWIAIQSYQHKSQDGRFPTPAEYRCMAYLSIINGVKGIWFYTGSGQKDFEGKPAGILNKPVEGRWDYIKSLVHELREFSPVIMSPKPLGMANVSPAKSPVEFTLREVGGTNYLIAANKSPQPQTVTFRGSVLKNRNVKVLFEEHRANVRGDALKDQFEGFGVHVYQLD
jgi:hypothetical protein